MLAGIGVPASVNVGGQTPSGRQGHGTHPGKLEVALIGRGLPPQGFAEAERVGSAVGNGRDRGLGIEEIRAAVLRAAREPQVTAVGDVIGNAHFGSEAWGVVNVVAVDVARSAPGKEHPKCRPSRKWIAHGRTGK